MARYKLLAFVLSAALAGLAGATKTVVFQLASLTDAHWHTSGEVVLMTLLGGLGTVFGPVVGAFVIVGLQNELADRSRFMGTGDHGRHFRHLRPRVSSRHRGRSASVAAQAARLTTHAMRACNVSGKQRRQARNVMRSQVFEAIEQVHYRFDTRCPQMHAQDNHEFSRDAGRRHTGTPHVPGGLRQIAVRVVPSLRATCTFTCMLRVSCGIEQS